MESSTQRRVYRFRLEPTADQERILAQFAGARRWVWNWALEQRRKYYKETGKSLSAKELSARLTALKDQPKTAWLREIDSQLLQQALCQRALSRKRKGSRNRAKARVKVARVHQRVANQRADFLHKLTTNLVKQHEVICTEDLSAKGLARTKLAKSVLDASLGALRWQLEYKGQCYGTRVVAVDRFYPSTQLCHVCGFKNEALTLADRIWVCPICGSVHDRDLNAALNIKKEGLRLLAAGHADNLNACGAGVRPASCRLTASKQESHVL